MKCKNCFNLEKMKDYARGDVYDWCVIKHDNPDTDMDRDCPFYKPRTNYDCIVSKTPEDLAMWMNSIIKERNIEVTCDGWLEWLKKEADDGIL